MATDQDVSHQRSVSADSTRQSWVWPWQIASLGLWLFALLMGLVSLRGRLGPVELGGWLPPVALLLFLGLGLRMRSKLVTVLYIAGSSAVTFWWAMASILDGPLLFAPVNVGCAAIIFLPTVGMIRNWSHLR